MLRTQKQPANSNYTLGDNFFSDQAPGEMGTRFKYNYITTLSQELIVDEAPVQYEGPLPASFDWTSTGAITSPKNQGYCGANWAYAAVSAIESAHFIIQPEKSVEMAEVMSVQ